MEKLHDCEFSQTTSDRGPLHAPHIVPARQLLSVVTGDEAIMDMGGNRSTKSSKGLSYLII